MTTPPKDPESEDKKELSGCQGCLLAILLAFLAMIPSLIVSKIIVEKWLYPPK
jgi:hypothetical protein